MQPHDDTPPVTVRGLFSSGPIVITTKDNTIRIGIDAPPKLLILRDKMLEEISIKTPPKRGYLVIIGSVNSVFFFVSLQYQQYLLP
ncbi:MAG: carbon storage regulator [Candidatus Thiodiazotropha sp. (ex Lucinoma annulata)]|nr:carbon storage regulator [Candidatus Thiodiazotropha sp. (ex Lucinoma borealis)]MCU7882798.1 carbon storage regulator [Candidatus Thiodiazotropha sp. (ex Lucinoma annulata)]